LKFPENEKHIDNNNTKSSTQRPTTQQSNEKQFIRYINIVAQNVLSHHPIRSRRQNENEKPRIKKENVKTDKTKTKKSYIHNERKRKKRDTS